MILKSLLLSLAALCFTPLLAQHPSVAEPTMLTPPQHQQEAPMRTVMADGSVLLCDSTVTYDSQDLPRSKGESTYDANGNQTRSAYYTWQDGAWVFDSYTLYYYSLHTPESITQIISDTQSAPRKQLLPDGRIVIVRDGRSYNVSGQVMK